MKFYTNQFDLNEKRYTAEASELGLPVGEFPRRLIIAEPNTLVAKTFDFCCLDQFGSAMYRQTGDVRLTGGNFYSVKIYND